jgi:hypothetical protein
MAVDPRTPASITAITLLPSTAPLSLDDAPLFAAAVVSGSGALDGHLVSVTVTRSGAPQVSTASTDLGGAVAVRIDDGAYSGSVTVAVSVVDPATSTVRSDTRSFTIVAGTLDGEPNGDLATASPLRIGRTVGGTLDGTSDRQDTFAAETVFDGTLEIDLRLGGGVPAGGVVIVVRNAAGQEIARRVLSGSSELLSVQVPAGAVFVTIESTSGAASYSLSTRLVQADVSVSAVTPMSGAPGTLVTIDGLGFSPKLDENQVFFSAIAAEVVSATSTRIQARVPANAVNGQLEVISGDRAFTVEGFATGAAGPRPAAFVLPEDPTATREDPMSGAILDVTRLIVTAGPSITRSQMDGVATTLGGRIAGYIPLTNQYVLEFLQNRTLDGLNALRQQLLVQPAIKAADYNDYAIVDAPPSRVDTYDASAMFEGTSKDWSGAHDLIRLREAVDLVRSTPPFTNRNDLKEVRVAVVDTGFNPGANASEFSSSGLPAVELLTPSGIFGYTYAPTAISQDGPGHGTLVTSIIAAANDGSVLSGVLNSLVDSTELPFPAYVYAAGMDDGTRNLNPAKVTAALDHIRARVSTPIQVINLSFGNYPRTATAPCTGSYGAALRAFRGRALIVASAGNDGVEARCHFPSAYATTEPHVMSIGAVAVAGVDGTVNEQVDDRAIWENAAPPGERSLFFRRCNPAVKKRSSNCLPGVTLTAPGEEVPGATLLIAVAPGPPRQLRSSLRSRPCCRPSARPRRRCHRARSGPC